MSGARDGAWAHDILLSFAPLSRHGPAGITCGRHTRRRARGPTWDPRRPRSKDGKLTQGKHPGDWNPPRGAAIWLGRRYDGNMDGDVFIAGAYDGDHSATDQPTYGKTGVTSIQVRLNLCGREYLGWSDHVLDCPIIGAIPPEPEPEPKERIMKCPESGCITKSSRTEIKRMSWRQIRDSLSRTTATAPRW